MNPRPEHAKCGVPPLSNEQDGKPFNESSNKPKPEPCSRKGAEDYSAERQTAERRTPDARMPLASSPGSAVSAKAGVPLLSNESGGKHAGGSPRTPDQEHGSRVGVMDTSAERQTAERRTPDARMPLASSPGSAVSAKAGVPPLSNASGGKHAGGSPRTPDPEHGSIDQCLD